MNCTAPQFKHKLKYVDELSLLKLLMTTPSSFVLAHQHDDNIPRGHTVTQSVTMTVKATTVDLSH